MAEAKPKAATTRKPAVRKTTTKRASRKTATPTPAAQEPQVQDTPREFTDDERQGMLASYAALKGAGLPVPEEISKHVEKWVAAEEERRSVLAEQQEELQQQLAEEQANGPWWVRNGYIAPFTLRLERQTERVRLELKPRGMPGDMHRIEKEDLESMLLQRNVDIGVIEVLTDSEAKRILAGQTTNMHRRSVHVPTAMLRNSKGEAGTQNPDGSFSGMQVNAEVSWNEQGVTVATLDPDQIQGKYSDTDVKRSALGGMNRTDENGEPVQQKRSMASQFIPTGGNPHIIESGPLPQQANIPQLDTAKAMIADDLARRRGAQGPGAALEGMRVTVAPTQKS